MNKKKCTESSLMRKSLKSSHFDVFHGTNRNNRFLLLLLISTLHSI